jgi:hypothetical protein
MIYLRGAIVTVDCACRPYPQSLTDSANYDAISTMTYHISIIAGLLLFLLGLLLMIICSFYIYLGVSRDVFMVSGAVLKNDFGSFDLAGVWMVALIGEIIGAIWVGAGAIILSIAGR